MLICLTFVQAHAVIPHHHHDDDAHQNWHVGDHGHRGRCVCNSNVSAEFETDHPEVTPHDEPHLGLFSLPHTLHFDFVAVLPEVVETILPLRIADCEPKYVRFERSYATGPPGQKSSRAPPSTSIA